MRTSPGVSGVKVSFCPLSVLKIFRGIFSTCQFYESAALLQVKTAAALDNKGKKAYRKIL
jgi:hypothetical protein